MRSIVAVFAFLVLAGLSFSVDVSSCTVINSPGTYNLIANVSGAPYSFYGGSYTTCIQINSSSVTLDCGRTNGITTTGTAAVEVEAPGTNVIIQNCVLNNGIGVDVLGMSSGRIINNSINPSGLAGISGVLAFAGFTGSDILYNNITGGTYGIWEPGDQNLIGNNRLISQGSIGIVDGGTGNMITNNYVSGSSGDGMLIDGSGQYVDSNTVTSSAGNGVDDYAYNQTFTFNTVSNSGNYGIWAGGEGSGDYTPYLGSISYNSVYGSGNTGIEVRGARNVTFANNNVYSNAEGIHLQDSQGEGFHPALYNVFSGNNVHDNTGDGFNVVGVSSNTFTSNTGSSNGGHGMYISGSDTILVDPSTFCYNTGGEGILVSSSTNINISSSTACFNAYHGIHLDNTNSSYVTGNTAYNNSGDGIALDDYSSGDLVNLNTAYGNTGAFSPGTGSDGIYLSGSANNNLVRDNTVHDNTNTGLSVTFSSGNTLINNTAYNQQNWYGIYLHGATGTVVTGNTAYGNPSNGFESNGASGDNYSGNTAHDNGGDGFHTDSSPTDFYVSNDAYSNGGSGFGLNSPSGITISGNNATGNGGAGFSLSGGSGNSVTGNRADGNNNQGFILSSSTSNTLTGNNASSNSLDNFYLGTGSDSNTLVSNRGSSSISQNGFVIGGVGGGSSGNTITSNTADGNHYVGFIFPGSSDNNTLTGNAALDNGLDGFFFQSSSGNTLTGNNATSNNQTGFTVQVNSNNNVFSGGTLSGNSAEGIRIVSSSGNSLSGITSSGNNVGFVVQSSSTQTSLANDVATGNAGGFRIDSSTFTTVTNATASGSGGDGILISNANNTVLSNTHLYNNGQDLHVIGFGTVYNATSTYFDNPAGNFQNYTNLSISDTLNSEYEIRWSPVPTMPGASGKYFPFAGKFVNITNLSATTIDSIVWHWNSAELAGYNEIRFELWKNSSNVWYLVSDTPDTVNNQFAISNLSSFSVFGILQNNLSTNISAVKLNQTVLPPSPGGLVQFNITVNDTGDLNLNPVTVVDVLPAGLTLYSASPAPDSIVGQTLTWNNLGPMAANTTSVLHVNATVDPGVVSNSTPTLILTNYANTTGTDKYGNNVSASSTANVTVYYAAVSVLKVDVTPVLTSPGGLVQWKINVTNPGQVALEPVAVTDVLPAGFTYTGASPAADSVAGQTLDWNDVGPLAPGASAVIMMNSSVAGSVPNGTYFNNVNVTGTPPNGADVTASDSGMIGIYAPGISVVKTLLNDTLVTLLPIPFSLNVTNTGSINLTVDVVDTHEPFNVSFDNASVTPSMVNNTTIVWANYTLIQPGQSSVIYLNLTSINGKDYVNYVTVTGYPPNGFSVSDNSSAPFLVVFPIPPGRTPLPAQTLSVSLQTNCTANVVTVTSGGAPVENADVVVDGNSAGMTNSSGQVSFQGCGRNVVVRVSKGGYQDAVDSFQLVDCGVCQVQCTTNDQCPSDQQCVQNRCVAVECSCGVIQSHACVNYQCCSDNDCGPTQVCVEHQCKPRPGCTSDSQCLDSQQCLSPSGAPATAQVPGSCQNVTGQCGYVSSHVFVPYNYTCGPEPGCPSCPAGQNCVAHQCLSNDISCPSTGIVGTSKTCLLTENNTACGPQDNCSAIVTGPDGKNQSVTPDENGNVQVPLSIQGRYVVTLLKNGQVVKQVFVDAVPQAAPPTTPEKPGAAGPDIFTVGWLLVLLLVVIGSVIYWRGRGQKGK